MKRLGSWLRAAFASLVVVGLIAGGGWASAQQNNQDPDRDQATTRDTERDADEQSDDQRQREREQRQREQRERQQNQRLQDQTGPDQRGADQRIQDQRFQDQSRQDQRIPQRDRPVLDDRRRAQRQQEEGQGAWLGVYLADAPQQNGALVRSIYPTGPAARAGFRPNDVIVAIDGQRVREPADAIQLIDRLEPRMRTEVVVLRNNQETTLTTTLGDRQAVITQQRGEFGRPGAVGQAGYEEDEFASIPPHLMELEHHRRMAEQHQRIEEMIERLHQEVRQLREDLRMQRATRGGGVDARQQ